tara:strand:+ start:5299 stop:5799 length:501 start_codon:yes stop_codon:yes gene_type:complete
LGDYLTVTFYLCGPILHDEDRNRSLEWREMAFDILTSNGYDVFNPMVSEQYGNVHYDEAFKELIVPRDKLMIDRSDVVIVNYIPKELSIGTCMEVMYAHMQGKKVIWFAEDDELCMELENNPWVIAHNDWEFVRPFSAEGIKNLCEWFHCFQENPTTKFIRPSDFC